MIAADPRPLSARYEALARDLTAAPDPVRAIASELADQHGRLDAVLRRLDSIEARISYVAEAGR